MNLEQTINKMLKGYGGTNPFNENMFRVVWSTIQTEVRKRDYDEYYGKLFVRNVRETKECKKYPLIKDRWLLEKWIPPDRSYTNDIVSAKEKGSYECIYIFQDCNMLFLPLDERVAKLVVKAILYPGSLGQITEDSELAAFKEEQKESDNIDETLGYLYEQLNSKSDQKYLDGFTLSINPTKRGE